MSFFLKGFMCLFANNAFSCAIFKHERVCRGPPVSHQLALPQVWPQPMGLGISPGVHIVPDEGGLHLPIGRATPLYFRQAHRAHLLQISMTSYMGQRSGSSNNPTGSPECFQILSGVNYHTVTMYFKGFSHRRIPQSLCGQCNKKLFNCVCGWPQLGCCQRPKFSKSTSLGTAGAPHPPVPLELWLRTALCS